MPQVAFLGCGHIHTPGFIKRLQARPSVQVTRVWDHDTERAARRSSELGATISTPEQVLTDPAIHAVIICSETHLHRELVLSTAASGKHMFVEKPLGFSAEDARVMSASIAHAGVMFQTGYFMRGTPAVLWLREQIQAGRFGKITRVRAANCHAGLLKGWFDGEWKWMADPSQAGCGALGDLGTHVLDLLLWMFGPVREVAAATGVFDGRHANCDETGEALLRFESGAIGTLAGGWLDHANPAFLQVSGTDGFAFIHNGDLFVNIPQLAGADGKSPWQQLPEAWPHAFDLFLDAIEGKAGVPLVPVEEAAACNIVMAAIYQAAAQRRWVSIGADS